MKRMYCVVIFVLAVNVIVAQPTPFLLKGALKQNRQQLYRNLVKNTITKNLSLPLHDSTETLWQDAFWAMELINYKSAWCNSKIHEAINHIQQSSTDFQRGLIELVYTNYPGTFLKEIKSLSEKTADAKIFAMCCRYLLSADNKNEKRLILLEKTNERLLTDHDNPILLQLQYQLKKDDSKDTVPSLKALFAKDFLSGNVVMISVQRRNRNYPGLVLIRNGEGEFIKLNDRYFSVPQLARSISGLPGYLTNGNTPEGIFRMDGFDTSQSNFIGPTTNIQLTMPFEQTTAHFFKDSSLINSSWNIEWYKNILPESFNNYLPIYQTWFAGKAMRTEIIAHGTTIDPSWYKNKPWYPLTPTQGCLCTKEIWNEENGRLTESDQVKLVDAILQAGGPNGYAIVINIDDQQKEVELNELLNFLP
jgi:hypothetical protein